jgi:hypothetical protein
MAVFDHQGAFGWRQFDKNGEQFSVAQHGWISVANVSTETS